MAELCMPSSHCRQREGERACAELRLGPTPMLLPLHGVWLGGAHQPGQAERQSPATRRREHEGVRAETP